MKIYKVITGYEVNYYGNSTNEEIAQYFFSKDKAEELQKTSAFILEEIEVTRFYETELTNTYRTHIGLYEKELEKAKKEMAKNPKVKIKIERLAPITQYRYKIKEIEVK